MHKPFQRLLLSLLILILPAQGFASALMSGCMLAPADAVEWSASAAAQPKGDCHETMPAAPADPSAAEHQCSHCAACCVASAMLGNNLDRLRVAPVVQVQMPSLSQRFSGFIPDGPERPPRSHLA